MGFRITTNMQMNSYRYNLQNSTKKLSDARDMVLTGRYFNSFAEDPAAATLAFRLRRSWYQTSNHITNTQDVYSKFNTAWHDLTGIVHDLTDTTARVASIRGNNGSTGEARSSLAITLREMAESVVQAMNQKLGDHFIFAGNDALNPPFSWKDGKLLYRGVDVLGGWVDFSAEYPVPGWIKRNPDTGGLMPNEDVPGKDTAEYGELGDWDKAWCDYYWDQYYREMNVVPCPSSRPEWADKASFFNADGSPRENDIKTWLQENSANGVTKADEAWIQYFQTKSKADPENEEWIDEEYHKLIYEPEWFAKGPGDAERKSEDPYVQAWVEYYDYYQKQQDLPEEPVPDPSEYVPEWTKNEGCFDEDGKLDVDAVLKLLGKDSLDKASDLDKVWIEYYGKLYDAQGDLRTLKKMSGEKMYIDLGMGAAENSPNNPVTGTYFNSALCGIDFLGFGVDEDGDPKNLALIMRELADVFDKWGENGQMYLPDDYRDMSYEDIQAILNSKDPDVKARAAELRAYHAQQEEKAFRLMDKLKAAQEHLTAQWVDLDAQSLYLQTTESRLTTQATDLNIEFLNVEQVDLAEAITNFSWQQYCYNAALRIGNQLLSQSLIDYMG